MRHLGGRCTDGAVISQWFLDSGYGYGLESLGALMLLLAGPALSALSGVSFRMCTSRIEQAVQDDVAFKLSTSCC